MTRNLLGVLAMTIAASGSSAQPPGPESPSGKGSADRVVIDALKDVHNKGAELYNAGDAAGCYRMYQGALIAIRPFLTHRPAVQKVLDDGLVEVAKTEGVKIQAFRMHEIIEEIRGKLKVELKGGIVEPAPKKDPPSKSGSGN
jgi:hypothetical protein